MLFSYYIKNKCRELCLIFLAALLLTQIGWAQYSPGAASGVNSSAWTEIQNTHLRDVAPPNNFGGSEYNFHSYVQFVTEAWNSGAFDTFRNRLLIWGGGHFDYFGNELYALDVTAGEMLRLTDPAVPIAPDSPCTETLANGTQPNARHTYDGLEYLPGPDRMFLFGGALSCDVGPGGSSDKTWTFDLKTSTWHEMGAVGDIPETQVVCCAYDPNTENVYLHSQENFYVYNYENNRWTRLTSYHGVGYHFTAVIDPVHKKFIMIGNGEEYIFDIGPGSTYQPQQLNSTGANEIVNRSYPGLAYYPPTGEVIAWHGGDAIYRLNVETRVWTKEIHPGGPAALQNGTYKRWSYSPAENGFVVVNSVDENAFLFRFSESDINVGENKAINSPAEAAALAQDGSVIRIDAGIYESAPINWPQNNLTIIGMDAGASMQPDDSYNGGAFWNFTGSNIRVENLEFSRTLKSGDGVALGHSGGSFILKQCRFQENDVAFSVDAPNAEIQVERCQFLRNGVDGASGISVLNASRFFFQANFVQSPRGDAHFSGSAAEIFLLYNRFSDEGAGSSNKILEFPNGGMCYLVGNILQKGENAMDSIIVSYGAGGIEQSVNYFYAVNNTLVNDYSAGLFFYNAANIAEFGLFNNLYVGAGELLLGDGALTTNLHTLEPGFVERDAFNYNLTKSSPAINFGQALDVVHGFDIRPAFEYVHPASQKVRPIYGALDAGAFEFEGEPLTVQLSSFQARFRDDDVMLSWTTASEHQALGFHVLKSVNMDENYVQVNPTRIAAEGTTRERQYYSFIDDKVLPGVTYFYKLQQIDFNGDVEFYGPITVHAHAVDKTVPADLTLHGNYPNPFNGETIIEFELTDEGRVLLEIFDMAGNSIKQLVNSTLPGGLHSIRWNGTNERGDVVSNGAYFYRLKQGAHSVIRKMTLLK